MLHFFGLWVPGCQGQVTELSDTLPSTIENGKQQLMNTTIGRKVIEFLSSSGNSQKTMSVVKKFFSSSFGILSDFYIIILMAAFFIASPGVYKKGIVHLTPPAGKETANRLLNELGGILKNWLKGQIFGFFFIAVLTGIGLWVLGMPPGINAGAYCRVCSISFPTSDLSLRLCRQYLLHLQWGRLQRY